MSYPRKIHTLIVEDEDKPASNYRHIFDSLGKKFDLAKPLMVHCLEDAEAALRASTIYHLLIVDLGLPLNRREEAGEGVGPGLRVLELAAERHDYPVPAVVVISGRLNQTKLPGLRDRLQPFWYGEAINKGMDEDTEIAKAIAAVHRYCDVGIHIADGKGILCPTLSPREDDMLRNCVLRQGACIGVNLAWWGSYASHSLSAAAGLTKVLAGRFILDEGMEFSHPSFFKFEAVENAPYAQRDIAIMGQKLTHVKPVHFSTAGPRSLLVTQKVGESQDPPVPLAEFLRAESDDVIVLIPEVVSNVVEQLKRLGQEREERRPVKDLLWPYHSGEGLEKVLASYPCELQDSDPDSDPVSLFVDVSTCQASEWVPVRACNHGDLNSTNVAVDKKGDTVHGYIFDAAGVRDGVSVRDLAYLEVTSLLHHPQGVGIGIARACADLYESNVILPASFDPAAGADTDLVRNIRQLIAAIRRGVNMGHAAIYALMVFDVALLQLGGLAIDLTGNKISNPSEAVAFARIAARWYRRVRDAGEAAGGRDQDARPDERRAGAVVRRDAGAGADEVS